MARKPQSELLEVLMLGLREQASRTLMFHQAIAERAGLGPTDMKALDLARTETSLTAGQLAKITGLTTSATTSLLDRLERRGFVERRRDPTDRRKVVVAATPQAGTDTNAYEQLDTWLRGYLSDYDEATLDLLVRVVTDLNRETARLTAELTAEPP